MSRKQKKALIRIGISAACFIMGLLLTALFPTAAARYIAIGLMLAGYLIVGGEVLIDAFTGIKNGK